MRIPLTCALIMAVFPTVMIAQSVATRIVSVTELEQDIAAHRGGWDTGAVHKLSDLKLSQRLSSGRLELLLRKVGGSAVREALIAIADESQFRELPRDEDVGQPIPSKDEQKKMLARALVYTQQAAAGWPSFSAARDTLRYEGTATAIPDGLQDDLTMGWGRKWLRSPGSENWECPGQIKMDHARLVSIEKGSQTILVRAGHELHTLGSNGGEFTCMHGAVSTWDEFGELAVFLPLVMNAGQVNWSHWEQGPSGLLAVFRCTVAIYVSVMPYAVTFPPRVSMEGEIAFDPETGTVFRLAIQRKWKEVDFDKGYDTLVEYGAVSMAGATYFLPLHRVAIFRAPFLRGRNDNKESEKIYRHYDLTASPEQEYLNDVRFNDYRPEVRRGPQEMQASLESR